MNVRQGDTAVTSCRILVFAPSFMPAVKAGGPARSLTNLAQVTSTSAWVEVVTRDRDLGDAHPFPGLSGKVVTTERLSVHYLQSWSPKQWRRCLRTIGSRDYDLILINSVWDIGYALLPATLKLTGRIRGPVVVMPRGELEPGALAISSRKKALAGPIFRAVLRRVAYAFGATSEAEAININAWMGGVRILTTQNNVPDPIPYGAPQSPHSSLRLLFISRINEKKGLLQLLDALMMTRSKIDLQIVGPVEDSALWSRCRRRIQSLPLTVSVTHLGPAGREEVAGLLWNADCMALLTAGENYGHVIAEALQAGCPVIATPTTPFTQVLSQGGGSVVPDRDDAAAVAGLIDEWADKTEEQLAQSRRSARRAYEAFAAEAGPNIVELALASIARDRQRNEARVSTRYPRL